MFTYVNLVKNHNTYICYTTCILKHKKQKNLLDFYKHTWVVLGQNIPTKIFNKLNQYQKYKTKYYSVSIDYDILLFYFFVLYFNFFKIYRYYILYSL